MVKISEVRGYTVFYSSEYKQFILRDKEENEVARAKTQEQVELQIEKLVKLAYKFPIPAFKLHYAGEVMKGRITSLNPDDKSAYFAYDDKRLGSHEKVRLISDRVFEITEANTIIHEQVIQYHAEIKSIEGKINALIQQLEKPINREYFGLDKDTGWR